MCVTGLNATTGKSRDAAKRMYSSANSRWWRMSGWWWVLAGIWRFFQILLPPPRPRPLILGSSVPWKQKTGSFCRLNGMAKDNTWIQITQEIQFQISIEIFPNSSCRGNGAFYPLWSLNEAFVAQKHGEWADGSAKYGLRGEICKLCLCVRVSEGCVW